VDQGCPPTHSQYKRPFLSERHHTPRTSLKRPGLQDSCNTWHAYNTLKRPQEGRTETQSIHEDRFATACRLHRSAPQRTTVFHIYKTQIAPRSRSTQAAASIAMSTL